MTTAEMPKRRAAEANEPREDSVPVTIRFPKSLHDRAIRAGRERDRTFASMVVYALRRYLNEIEQSPDVD